MMKSLAIAAGWTFLILWALIAAGLVAALLRIGARLSLELWTRLILWSVPSWLLVILGVHLPLWLAGFVLIPWQAGNVERRESRYYPGRVLLQFKAALMTPWGNEEDGIDGLRGGDPAQQWWGLKTRGLRQEQVIFRWSALRNPFNNLRYAPVLRPRFHPGRIGYVGTGDEPPDGQAGWAYVWQGLYSGLYIKTPTRWFWLAYKFRPSDAKGIDPADTRLPRADFALQLQRVRA